MCKYLLNIDSFIFFEFLVSNSKDSCGKIVDKYLECEYSVLLIDLILLKRKAYGHIIFNKRIKVI